MTSPDEDERGDEPGGDAPPRRRAAPLAPATVTRRLKGPGEIAGLDPAPSPPASAPAPAARPASARQAAQRLGLSAESRAAAYLMSKGYRIVARRYRTPFGEIDIVAQRRDTVVFVEVKARASLTAAAESISPRQRGRIVDAARHWLAGHPQVAGLALRFDVILIAPGTRPQHLAGAFEADD
ncbi:MAG: YraN family protein [Rhodovulum sp.]|nr:YraN family protein [Rhodovulum sp.]